jgi:hypothetical protein
MSIKSAGDMCLVIMVTAFLWILQRITAIDNYPIGVFQVLGDQCWLHESRKDHIQGFYLESK